MSRRDSYFGSATEYDHYGRRIRLNDGENTPVPGLFQSLRELDAIALCRFAIWLLRTEIGCPTALIVAALYERRTAGDTVPRAEWWAAYAAGASGSPAAAQAARAGALTRGALDLADGLYSAVQAAADAAEQRVCAAGRTEARRQFLDRCLAQVTSPVAA